jgi:hypothetical protein
LLLENESFEYTQPIGYATCAVSKIAKLPAACFDERECELSGITYVKAALLNLNYVPDMHNINFSLQT